MAKLDRLDTEPLSTLVDFYLVVSQVKDRPLSSYVNVVCGSASFE